MKIKFPADKETKAATHMKVSSLKSHNQTTVEEVNDKFPKAEKLSELSAGDSSNEDQ